MIPIATSSSAASARSITRRAFTATESKTYILHFATVPQPSWFIDPAPVVAKYDA